MVETPRRPANMGSLEDNLLGGLCCETTRQSRPGGGRKTLWRFFHIRFCTGKESKQTEARTSKNSGSSPAHKSDDGLSRGILRQYCYGGHENGSKRRATRRVSGWSGKFSGHCRQTAANSASGPPFAAVFMATVAIFSKYSSSKSTI